MNKKPWPVNYIEQRRPSILNIEVLEQSLKDAKDERPLQTCLAATPVLLRTLVPTVTDVWCFDRPSFGGELIPDFLLASRLSTGIRWTYVELESSNARPLNTAGKPSGTLNTALSQIRDWRIWLRENIAYARLHLSMEGIDAECAAVIVIGRRNMLPPNHVLKYQALSQANLTVMSYDRLVEMAKGLLD